MDGDLIHPWNPASAYGDWLRAGQSATNAELALARKVVEGTTPSDLEVAEARSLRAAASALRDAARQALRYLDAQVASGSLAARVRCR